MQSRPTLCAAALVACCAVSGPVARPWYVSGTGSDTNTGLDSLQALRTIGSAAGRTNPGDTVYVMNGEYTNAYPGSYVVEITRSGTANAWIIYMAYPGHTPRIRHNGWCGIKSQSASYIEINGLNITGNAANITLDFARANKGTAETSGGGIEFDGRNQTNHPHHIRIVNNTIGHNCGGGISMIQCDHVTIDNNVVHGNAWYSQWANSGISCYQNWRTDNATGYKFFVTRNVCYDNRSLVEWTATNALSDGNGIIIDDLKHTQNGSTHGEYTGRTLVANNVSFGNGGSGIHSYSSAHVDIVNNTAYHNGLVVNYACIYANSSSDVRILNNISWAAPGKPVNDNWDNTAVTYDYNIYYGGLSPVATGPNDRVADPGLANASTDPAVADFRLATGSVARDHGSLFAAVTTDITGQARPQGAAVDIGAYEMPVTAVTSRHGIAANPHVGKMCMSVALGAHTGASGYCLSGRTRRDAGVTGAAPVITWPH